MKNSLVIIFCEGESERVFYQKLITHLEKQFGKRKKPIVTYSVRGISRFSAKALAKFRFDIMAAYPGHMYDVFFAYDSDVFDLGKKPPVDWKVLETGFLQHGAHSVSNLIAVSTLEDWLINDTHGICISLKIKPPAKIKGGTGLEKIKNLYKMADKIYQKGYGLDKLLKDLDFNLIYRSIENDVKALKESIFD